MSGLKAGWRRVKFGEVVRLGKERSADPVAEGIERYVGLEHIEPNDLRVRSWGSVAEGTTFTTRFRPGQVLFGKRRAYQRKVAVADFEGVCSGDIYVFESVDPNRLLPELLPFLCQTESFFEHAVGTSAGSLSPRTNWTSLAEYELALPPLAEQRRMHLILSSMLNLEDSLRHASESARTVALAGSLAAFGLETSNRDGSLMGALRMRPGWRLLPLRMLAAPHEQAVQVGPFGGSLASRHFAESGDAILKVQNVGHDGYIDRSGFVYVTKAYASSLERYRVYARDVVVVAQGFTSGRVAIVRDADAGALISQHLIRVRLDTKLISPDWLWCFLRSPLFEEQVAPVMMKTTRPGLNTEDVLELRIPVPPLEEQVVLSDALTRLLSTPRYLADRALSLQRQRCIAANRTLKGEARS